jgi:predicted ATPase/class 3 adenylate cyclase/Tfp pilus assembly protein PilF
MAVLPTGTVTFLFTDIEGSTRLWERDASAMQSALARHDEILRSAIGERGGYVFKTLGDAFCAAFSSAPEALGAAISAQRALHAEEWEEGVMIRVRMAMHTGAVDEQGGDYFGPALNRVARLLSAGHGGQTLLSLATQELVRDSRPAGSSLRDLGERRLKDLYRPERVFQITTPDLPSEFPPLRTLENLRNNLPLQPTPLIGREREVGEVCERLGQEEVRLLTLTGPGGTGKTRLALQAAADLLEDFEDGVFFVSLAAVTDPDLFFKEIAGALGLRESGDVALEDLLKEYLGRRELLLVLDNFEHLLSAVPLLGGLLSAAPRLKVLATSRIPLGLYGEHEYAVPPLSVPDPGRLPDLEALSQYEAVRLFIDRASAAKAGFEITAENAPAVAEICVRLDGLPLAIELAAARVKLLPPKAILTRLANRLKLLTGGAKDLPERQRTLRGAIEWSHDLLDEGERTLFARLAVFSGGRTLEAIDAICDAEGDLPVDALDGVSSLLDKSLLRQEEGIGGEPRFVMLETIHEFAREKLEESGEAEEMKRAHAQYFLALAEEAYPGLKGANQLEWLERLEAEHDNMRAALSWASDRKETGMALGLGGALWRFWFFLGHFSEGRRWLEEALVIAGRGSPEARAMALAGVAALAFEQGELDRAREASEEGLDLLAGEPKDRSEARLHILTGLGIVAWGREDPELAARWHEEGVALSRQRRDSWWLARNLRDLGTASAYRGDLERATELYEESMSLYRERGDRDGLGRCLNNLGLVAYFQGDLVRAEKLIEEAVALFKEFGAASATLSPGNLGWLALLRNDLGKAGAIFRESLASSWDLGLNPLVQNALEGLACLAGAQAEAKRAARLWGAAQALHEDKVIPRDPDFLAEADARISVVRSGVGEEAWEEAWREGRAMPLNEAVDYAMEDSGDRAREQG